MRAKNIVMKKLLLLFIAGLFLVGFSVGSAQAEKIDFGTVPCEAFVKMDSQTLTMFYFWLDGYASAKSGDTVLDTSTVENDMTEMLTMCQKNPKKTILKVLELE